MSKPLITVITATTGNPLLARNVKSVLNQTYDNIQHLLVIDGPEHREKVADILYKNSLDNSNLDVLPLPYSIGKDRWNGHRIYGAATYMAEGDYFIYLDDDNALEPTHIEDCLKVVQSGQDWAYSFRNIVDKEHNFLVQDNCESLGKWHTVIHPQDFFVDVNCYFLPKNLALSISPVWYRKFREPGQMEIDRAIFYYLCQITQKYDSTYKYTVNYAVGNSEHSVQAGFFLEGNKRMLQIHNVTETDQLPWRKK